MKRSGSLAGHSYTFASMAELLARATPARSGDVLAGCAAESEAERVAAQAVLADVPLTAFLEELVVPYDDDEVTRLIVDSHDPDAFAPIAALTVGGLRDHLLTPATDTAALAPGLTPEMVAAVSKLMRVSDLVSVARRTTVTSALRTTIGLPGTMATRLQPNHPTDDPVGVIASIVDGLLHGCGDAVIGINPATDSASRASDLLHLIDDIRLRYDIPTQSCVLAHVTTTLALLEREAPVDLVFQSVAGTESANDGFGVTLQMLADAQAGALALGRAGPETVARNVMYFETGPGQRAVGRCPPRYRRGTGGSADAGGARLRGVPGVRPAAGQHRRRLHRTGVPLRRQADPAGRGSRTTSAGRCWACPWASTSATPTTPSPTGTTPTPCSPSSASLAARSSSRSRAVTT